MAIILKEHGVEVWVLTTKRKKVLTTDFLERSGEPHQVYVNEDWDHPGKVKIHPRVRRDISRPKYRGYYGLGAYRCYKGHQQILGRVRDQYALVFEDDAWPAHPSWRQFVVSAIELLPRFQVVSFHGRGVVPQKTFQHQGRQYMIPSLDRERGFVRCLGSLCYLVRKRVAHIIAQRPWDRLPMDLLLCNEYRFCVMEPSPFEHDRKHGSLVDPKKKKKRR